MSLFQKSVLNKYLKSLDSSKVDSAYEKFIAHFHNPEIQNNIRNSKEEQYQGEFLIDLFVNIFGYVKNPNPDFNLTTELKNIKDSKKTDGAILINGNALAVIELKGTETTDLSKVETQVFGYKNNQPNCNYVITSNYEKLRFYIDNAIDFEEFNLFELSKERFEILLLCLSSENLLKDIPKKIKTNSLNEEENITKKLYKDYSEFRTQVFNNLIVENPEYDKLTLFNKTQKLLDRFLFIFFAEDRLLLPPNSIGQILKQWSELKDKYDEYFPLYQRFKKYFGYLNSGHKGKQHDIFAYNGGLFIPDKILDNININDDILHKHTTNLTNYDFESDVSVNILGHIFEHSITEIEEIQNELSGIETDKSNSKRKKDGVFYTPKYITKYIVENTLGKLCEEKKNEINIDETEYEKKRKGRKKTTLKNLKQKLEEYRKWLLTVTICDPACGSGAFLNQALEFLIKEHKYIDELQANLFDAPIVFSDIENTILENNLFGVDINQESIEIAKLSLWLCTAQKERKLTSLSNNIKCGNSLIDDPEVAGNKAFNWQNEFPQVFEKGGFDVVIGNPPYVQIQSLGIITEILKKQNFKTFEKTGDLYCLFYELGNIILKEKGILGFITSNKWMRTNYGKSLRNYLIENTQPFEIIDLGSGIFESATVDSNLLIFEKNSNTRKKSFKGIDLTKETDFVDFTHQENKKVTLSFKENDVWTISSISEQILKSKFDELGTPLNKWDIEIKYGIKTGLNEAFIISESIKDELILNDFKNSEIIKPILRGRDVNRYITDYQKLYLINTHNGFKENPKIEIEHYPFVKKYLEKFEPKLSKRYDKGSTKYNLRNCAYVDDFNEPKIIWKEMSSEPPFTIDKDGFFTNDTITFIVGEGLEYLLTLLNSKLSFYIYSKHYSGGGLGSKGVRFKKDFLSELPLINLDNHSQQPFVEKSNIMLSLNTELQEISSKFQRTIKRKFEIDKLPKKLQDWYLLTYGEFIKELGKKKIKLSLSEESEWEDFFISESKKVIEIKESIKKTDNEIDKMVYQLYNLTDDEIKIIEDSTN